MESTDRRRLTSLFALGLALIPLTAHSEPLKLAPTGHPVIEAQVNGTGPFTFVVDTAAQRSVVYPALRDAIDFGAPIANAMVQGASGSQEIPIYLLRSFRSETLSGENFPVVGLDTAKKLEALHGIVGVDLLAGKRVEFDVRGGKFFAHAPGAGPDTDGWTAVPFESRLNFAMLKVEVNGTVVTAVLDTGASRSIVNWHAATAAGVTRDDPKLLPADDIHGATNDATTANSYDFATVNIGGLPLEAAKLTISDLPVFAALGLSSEPAMILGMDRLKSYRFIVDYPGSIVLLQSGSITEPNPS